MKWLKALKIGLKVYRIFEQYHGPIKIGKVPVSDIVNTTERALTKPGASVQDLRVRSAGVPERRPVS